jgi:hypothetical protein
MIPYIEVLRLPTLAETTLKKIAIVEQQECWFEISYQDVGEFEIMAAATKANLEALKKWRFVKIPNKRFVWIITAVRYMHTTGGARVVLASGYEAKWLLSRRCILTQKELQGNITTALYGLVNHALGTGAQAARKIAGFSVAKNQLLIDVSGTQAPRGNLLEYEKALLKEQGCGSQVFFENGTLAYTVFVGRVKTASVRFAQSLDNLLKTEYLTDDADKATFAYVVSKQETELADGAKKDVEYTQESNAGATGIDRAEIVVESNISTKYEDADGNEQETTPDSALYQGWLLREGETALAEHKTIEEVQSELDIAHSAYEFDRDFFLGDLVRAQDDYFNFYADVRISKYTFKQDANGYGEEAEYGGQQ